MGCPAFPLQGTFLQIETQLDQAMAAYERCCAAAEREGLQVPTDVLIKIAWVYMDKEDTKKVRRVCGRDECGLG